MYRGFKAWAEEESRQQRRNLGLLPSDRLPASRLAEAMGIAILAIQDVPDVPHEVLHHLTKTDSQSWSAFTISSDNGTIVIHNSAHSRGRQESNLMHEMAHVLCKHRPGSLIRLAGFSYPLRTFDPGQEDEASWLGGCLHLPRAGLLWAVRSSMTNASIADHYVASLTLVKYRRQMTGIDRQLSPTPALDNKEA